MSRVTPGGHHISGAVDVDLEYVAERAVAAARRDRGALIQVVEHARTVDREAAGSPTAQVAWRTAIVQATHTARLYATAEDRLRTAGFDAGIAAAERLATLARIESRVYTIDGIGVVDGRGAAVLLGVLISRDESIVEALLATYLDLVDVGAEVCVADADPLPVAPTDPPDDGGPYYRVGRIK